MDPETPELIVCPRGWSACMASHPDGTSTLQQLGTNSPLPTVVWRDVNQDGVRDEEARYSYDRFGNLTTAWIDNNGNGIPEYEARNTYDARGLLIEAWGDHYYDQQGPLLRRYTYSDAGWLTSGEEAVGDAAPHARVTYQYDAHARMIFARTLTGSSSSETYYVRDAAGNVIREWSAKWQKRSSYDAQGRVIRVWADANPGPTQYEQRMTYDAAGQLVQTATASGVGGKFTTWNMEYDAAGRTTRSWSDTDGDGKPESETRTSYDAAGRTTAHEDLDGDGPEISNGTDYNAAGQPTRRWRDVDGDGKPETETRLTYDPAGHVVREETSARGQLQSELRWEYVNGKLVRWWIPQQPAVEGRFTYDSAGNRVIEIDRDRAATHYEYDLAMLATLRSSAPARCTEASSAHPELVALDPQRAASGGLYGTKAAPGPIVVPVPPAVPALDPQGFVASPAPAQKNGKGPPSPPPDTDATARALVSEYQAFVHALQEKALADHGWARVALHEVPAGTKARYLRGLRVAQDVRPCGEPTQYVLDRQGKVFVPNVAISCKRQVVIKIHGMLGMSGCGTEPRAVDLYAEVPANARLQTGVQTVVVTVADCMQFQPDEGFAPPP